MSSNATGGPARATSGARNSASAQVVQLASPAGAPPADSWTLLRTASSEAEYLPAWLNLQCEGQPGIDAGLLLLARDGRLQVGAAWNGDRIDVADFTRTADNAVQAGHDVAFWRARDGHTEAPGARDYLIGWPVLVEAEIVGVAVVRLLPSAQLDLPSFRRRFAAGIGQLEGFFWKREAERARTETDRAAAALDLLATLADQSRIGAAAAAFADELAARLKASRVSVGLDRRDGVRLVAISHITLPRRRSELVDALESAMDETVDQNRPVASPQPPSDGRVIALAHESARQAARAGAIVSVPLVSRGAAIGAITVETSAAEGFAPGTVELCELVGLLAGPALAAKQDADRWLAGRALDGAREALSALLGQGRIGPKLGAAVCLVCAVVLLFASGDYRVSAKSVLEGAVVRAAAAPFEGFVAQASARSGDIVKAGQVMAQLDDRDLKLERLKWTTELDKAQQQYREALAKRDRAGMSIVSAQAKQAEAEVNLVEEKLRRTQIAAPFDGVVVSGDLTDKLGTPVERGKILYEVAPLEAYRVILRVDERDVSQVKVGQTGSLILSALPAHPLRMNIVRTTPVSLAEDGRNYFRVEAALDGADATIRPGMEGIGKITVGERSLVWIWTHTLTDWARLTAWNLLP